MHPHDVDTGEMLRFLLDFCAVRTVNSSEGAETAGAAFLCESLKDLAYFRENPECLYLQPVEGDALSRCNAVAFLKAPVPTGKTILLSGHIDTVDTEVCGELSGLATSPREYTRALLNSEIREDLRRELASGLYLAGRGTADMKSGLAAQWAVIRYYARHRERLKANLLFIPVVDEENNAAGIHQAVSFFGSLQDKGYELLCCIDSEPTITTESKECGRIFLGTIGMVTPFALAVGSETHVGEYSEGLSAALMAFHLGTAVENSPAFTETYRGRQYPPICCLRALDFRKSYSVTVPDRFAMYFNFLFVKKRPSELLGLFGEAARSACRKALAQAGKPETDAKIVTYGELCREYEKQSGKNASESLRKFAEECPEDWDIQDRCLHFANRLCSLLHVEGPAFVIGFVPPYCPSRINLRRSAAEKKIAALAQNLAENRGKEGVKIEISEVYEGISDLSELGFQGDGRELELLRNNLAGLSYGTPYHFEAMQKLDIPVINIGPVGKDAHKMAERLYLPYFMDILPGLLMDFIEGMQQ